MTSRVLIAHYGSGDRRYALDGEVWMIGSEEGCDLPLADPTVSRRHARLSCEDGTWTIEDLGSSNGTQVNGRRLQRRQAVAAGAALQFGSLVCSLLDAEADEVELAVPPQSWADQRPAATTRTLSPTTVSSDRLTRFFTETLPGLTISLSGSGRHKHGTEPAQAVGALADLFGGVWTLSREGALLASSGHDEAEDADGGAQTFDADDWRLTWRHDKALEPATFERIAEPVLALVRLRPEPSRTRRKAEPETGAPPFPEPATRHDGLLNQYRQVARVARAGLNVLIEGGSGTGKELFARYLHAAGKDDQPLVTLNCASLPQDLLDAELFGIEKGVATGVDARPGKFEQADGGVIFLDEIGDMHAATQAKLLRVLQEREVFRIGGSKPRPARIQVVSATNRELEALVAAGDFRLDLYHRIADWTVRLPNLEERSVDVANLAAHFLRRACGELGHRFGGISRAALDCMHAYRWPGNVRELEREMKRCALFLDNGEALRSDHLDERIGSARDAAIAEGGLKALLARTEKRAIEQALQLCRGDVAAAAERLGIGKSTLYRQIRILGIETG